MLARLVVFVLIYSISIFLAGWVGYAKLIKPRLAIKAREQRRLLRASLTCYVCDKMVDPDEDGSVFEQKHWFHEKCFNQLVT